MSTCESESVTLESIVSLYGAATGPEFHESVERALQTTMGRDEFTLVSLAGLPGQGGRDDQRGAARILYSTRDRARHSRLEPMRLSREALETICDATEHPVDGSEAPELDINGTLHDVVESWRLSSGGTLLGALLFHSLGGESRGSDDAAIETLRHHLTAAFRQLVERECAHERVDRYQAKLEAINEVGELMGSLDVEVLLNKLMQLALYIVRAQVGSVILRTDAGVESRVEWGLPLEMARSFLDADGEILFERVLDAGESVLILDFEQDPEYRIERYDVQVGSYLCIPLISKNRVLGVINLLTSGQEGGAFSELDRDVLLTISGLAATSIENALLHEDSLEKERYRQSLAIARDIQQTFYPSKSPQFPGLEIAWRAESCDETGGDYFDFIPQDDRRLTVAVGDVSGHGIGAALLMASARASLRAGFAHDEPLAEVISRLNDQLEDDMELERFMTLFISTIGSEEEPVRFVNAGHDPPCIYRQGADIVEELWSTGMPLGLFAGAEFETGETARLEGGDVMLFTTDGVWEVSSPEGDMLGKPRLLEIFRTHARKPGMTAATVADGILEDVNAFTSEAAPRDDVTLVVMAARGPGDESGPR